MNAPRVEISAFDLIRRSFGTIVGVALVAASLTVLFLGSRTVMAIGGSCATGGPYAVVTPCPEGIAWMIPVSIFTGLIGLAVYGMHLLPVGPRMGILAWPGLFLSLGWAFLEAALAAPGGVDWGFLVCAVIFGLMGGLPLLVLLSPDAFRGTFWGPNLPPGARVVPDDAPAGPGHVRWTTSVTPPGDRIGASGAPAPAAEVPGGVFDGSGVVYGSAGGGHAHGLSGSAPAASAGGQGDVVSGLERLARLHEAGHLDDVEYQAAKARLLNGGH